ncbi:NAD(P)-dependent alcohol dehydrogenase [Enhygromyxa salina]|nr:NAD(P)-dependent alcohol dehydrogenase [Enhygromyxa salina]
MKAIVQLGYGRPDVLELREIDAPLIGDDEVSIRVRASSINHADWLILMGEPLPLRLVYGLLRPRNPVIGMDMAGEVVAVGAAVTQFKPGDEVYGEIAGAYAERVSVRQDQIALKPANLGFEQAACMPVAAMTALQGLRDKAKVQPGHKVLINGASGGVGTFAVQIAKALGAEVTGVCSTRNLDLVRSLGADHVLDYTKGDFTATAERYDVIFDLVGSASISACRRVLSPSGVYVSSVGRTGWLLRALLLSLAPGRNVVVLAAQPTQADLQVLAQMVEAGAITPVIDQRYTLSEVPQALRRQGEGHARGKSAIAIA